MGVVVRILKPKVSLHGLYFGAILYLPIFANLLGGSGRSQFFLNGVFLVLGIAVLTSLSHRRHKIALPKYSIVLLALAICVVFLSLITASSFGRIASDAGRLILAAFFVSVGYGLGCSGAISDRQLSRNLIVYGVLGTAFSLLVYAPPLWSIVDIYKGRQSDDLLQFHFMRASGFSGYPTDFGSILVLSILCVPLALQKGYISSKFALFSIAVVLAGLALSAARGSMLQFGGAAVIVYFSLMFRRKISRKLLRLQVLALVGASIAVFLLWTPISEMYQTRAVGRLNIFDYVMIDISEVDASVLHRFNELELAADVVLGALPVPTGESRQQPYGMNVIEGFHTHYLVRYGIPGVLIALTLIIATLKAVQVRTPGVVATALFIWFLSFFFFLAPFSDVWSRLRGLALYSSLIGMVLGIEKRRGFLSTPTS